jgi:hypothetical protein
VGMSRPRINVRLGIDRGFKEITRLRRNPDLKPLQGRDDYQRLLADLEKKLKTPGKVRFAHCADRV